MTDNGGSVEPIRRCGRYVNSHAEEHFFATLFAGGEEAGGGTVGVDGDEKKEEERQNYQSEGPAQAHALALSKADLSIWCYVCGCYVTHGFLEQFRQAAEGLKFNSSPLFTPSPSPNPLPSPSPSSATPAQPAPWHRRTDACYAACAVVVELGTGHHKPGHLESPDRLAAALPWLSSLARLRVVAGRPATAAELERVHSQQHLDWIDSLGPGSQLPADLFASAGTAEAVRRAAGGVALLSHSVLSDWDSSAPNLSCDELRPIEPLPFLSPLHFFRLPAFFCLCRGRTRHGFALVRPPGHHAGRAAAGGFCFVNNIAVGIGVAQAEYGLERVALLDWDVHHGNGAQALYSTEALLRLSIHRHQLLVNGELATYGAEGLATELGEGAGRGHNVNVAWRQGPEPPADKDYQHAFRRLVLPLLRRAREYAPGVIFVAAGFDSGLNDLRLINGGCALTPRAYHAMTSALVDLGIPLVLVLEGGYGEIGPPIEACLRALAGDRLDFTEEPPSATCREDVELTKTLLRPYWASLQNE